MELIKREEKAAKAASKWYATYYRDGVWRYNYNNSNDKEQTYDKLVGLGPNPSADEVDTAIGNKSWTTTTCDECGRYADPVVQVGQPMDYESATANMCIPCLQAALHLGMSAK